MGGGGITDLFVQFGMMLSEQNRQQWSVLISSKKRCLESVL